MPRTDLPETGGFFDPTKLVELPEGVPLDKMDIFKGALSGLQTLGGLWNAFQAMKLAKKQFKFTKDITETNLANQMKSYNTALADRARGRGVMEGQTSDQVAQYINANSLARNSARTSAGSVGGITAAALSNYNSYRERDPNARTGQ
jgi:hypothetical protein